MNKLILASGVLSDTSCPKPGAKATTVNGPWREPPRGTASELTRLCIPQEIINDGNDTMARLGG
jgi:hypothetical protein